MPSNHRVARKASTARAARTVRFKRTKDSRDILTIISDGKLSLSSNAITEINVAEMGLTIHSIDAFGKVMHWNSSSTAKAIGATIRTLERHRVDKKPFNSKVSENALEVARVSSIGVKYFGDVNRFNDWLGTPNIQFDNKTPKSLMHTVRGRELIKRVIRGLEYGFTA